MPCEPDTEKMWQSATEVLKADVAEIQGKIPDWVKGTYLRVGPGKFDFDNFTMTHWFDGYAIVSKFIIHDGKVSFTCKYLESDAYTRASAAKKPVICEFGTPAMSEPGRGLLSRIVSSLVPEFSDNANINLFRLGKEMYITGESCFFRSLSEKLTSSEKFETHKCFGLNLASAHPLTDTDGTTYNIGTSVLTGLKYHFVKIPAATSASTSHKETFKKSKIIASIPSRWNTLFSYNHSFGMTENYLVLIEQPFVVNGTKLLSYGLSRSGSNQCFSDWIEWRPELGNRFYVIEKRTGRVLKTEFMSETPFFFLHFINCFEDDAGNLVMYLSVFDNPEQIFFQRLDNLRSGLNAEDESMAYGIKFVLPLVELNDVNAAPEGHDFLNTSEEGGAAASAARAIKTGKGLVQLSYEPVVMEKGLELPAINQDFRGKKNKFYWASGLTSESHFRNALCKVNAETRQVDKWAADGAIFGEPVFIPRPGAKQEDDGVVMACMTNTNKACPDALYFFDANNMQEIGRAEFKERVPPSIHGLFLNSA